MGPLGCLGIKAEPEKRSGEGVGGRASQRRLREHGAALAHRQDVPIADEIGSDEPVDLERCYVARPACQIDNGIGPLLRLARRISRHQESDGATGRAVAILRHDKIAATRFAQLFGARQFWARRGLEARHGWRTGVGARHGQRGEEKAKEEQAVVSDGHCVVRP
jgi:hypothetical protein